MGFKRIKTKIKLTEMYGIMRLVNRITSGTWIHVVVIKSGDEIRFYKNGST